MSDMCNEKIVDWFHIDIVLQSLPLWFTDGLFEFEKTRAPWQLYKVFFLLLVMFHF